MWVAEGLQNRGKRKKEKPNGPGGKWEQRGPAEGAGRRCGKKKNLETKKTEKRTEGRTSCGTEKTGYRSRN